MSAVSMVVDHVDSIQNCMSTARSNINKLLR